jgi:hypothetical protein
MISARDVNNLPLNGRAYADLALLTPGVRANVLENQTVTSRDASYNVNGNRSEQNEFLLDGLDNNAYGTSNQSFSNQAIQPSPDAINEFRVETDNYSAEYGRSAGAVFNVSINSGTDHLHGKVWEYEPQYRLQRHWTLHSADQRPHRKIGQAGVDKEPVRRRHRWPVPRFLQESQDLLFWRL